MKTSPLRRLAWATLVLGACAQNAPAPEPAAFTSAPVLPQAAQTDLVPAAPAPPAQAGAPARSDEPAVPAGFSDLRAELDRQQTEGSADADRVAPLRAHLARQIEDQVEAHRADRIAREPAAPDPAYEALAAEIDEDARRREEKERAEVDRFRRQVFARLAQEPLANCIPEEAAVARLDGDFVAYRKLEADDFRARRASDAVRGRVAKPAAHVAVTILCVARPQLSQLGPNEFEARLAGLRFVSLLDREQSWWNRDAEHLSEEWTLRHEQIHFDLAELEARRLTTERDAVVEKIYGRGKTPMEAVEQLQQRWDAHARETRRGFIELSQRYDRETQHGRRLESQTEWFGRVKRGLRESR